MRKDKDTLAHRGDTDDLAATVQIFYGQALKNVKTEQNTKIMGAFLLR